jgi:hypothetical protein
MSGIRQKMLPFAYGGKTYLLRCNMAVLADVQEENGGRLSPALSGERGMKNALQFLAAMMNDYADEQCWPERYSWRDLGRVLRPKEVPASEIIGLVLDALTARETAAEGTQEETAGN